MNRKANTATLDEPLPGVDDLDDEPTPAETERAERVAIARIERQAQALEQAHQHAAPQVYQSIANVIGELAVIGISKDRRNEQQGFAFRGIDDVYNALAPLLSRHGLLILPDVLENRATERQSRSGGALFHTTLRVRYTLISSIDGSSHNIVGEGEAMDSGDKSLSKALSMAYKSMALQLFCIPVQGNEDADITAHEVSSMMPAQMFDALKQHVTDTGGDAEKWQAYIEAAYPRGVPHTAHEALKTAIDQAAVKRRALAAKQAQEAKEAKPSNGKPGTEAEA